MLQPRRVQSWSQNLGHEMVLTTLTSYGHVRKISSGNCGHPGGKTPTSSRLEELRLQQAKWRAVVKIKGRARSPTTVYISHRKEGGEGLAVINGISCPPAKTGPHIASQQKIKARLLADAISNFGSCLQSPNGCAGAPMIATPGSSALGEGVDELLAKLA